MVSQEALRCALEAHICFAESHCSGVCIWQYGFSSTSLNKAQAEFYAKVGNAQVASTLLQARMGMIDRGGTPQLHQTGNPRRRATQLSCCVCLMHSRHQRDFAIPIVAQQRF